MYLSQNLLTGEEVSPFISAVHSSPEAMAGLRRYGSSWSPWSLWGALPATFWGVSAEQTPTPYCVSHAYQVCCCR